MSKAVVAAITVVVVIVTGGAIFAVSAGSGEDRKAAIASTPTVSIYDYGANEGTGGSRSFTFDVRRSSTAGSPTVRWSTVNGTASSSGGDFLGKTNGLISFASGSYSAPVSVTVYGDSVVEPDETFSIKLSSPSGSTIARGTALGTIKNDDVAAGFTVNDVAVYEGNSGKTAATFDVTRTSSPSAPASVNVSTVAGTANAPDDFEALTNHPVTFAAGEATKKVTVNVIGNEDWEYSETFDVQLSGASGATIADATGNGKILNDDEAFTYIKIDDVSVTEGNSGTKIARFTISRNNAGSGTSQLRWTARTGTAGPADFGSGASAVIQMGAGVHTVPVEIPIVGDTTREANETFTVELSELMGGGSFISDASGVGTIVNDD